MKKQQTVKNTWSKMKATGEIWVYSGIMMGTIMGHLTNNLGTCVAVGYCAGLAMQKMSQRSVETSTPQVEG
ncbi:hypothetical protein [Paenibacillus alvei]|uniref:hypothetical protein n=1 Tax=Paenibacillus alvei TaxID=44250 RepID=UPI0013DD1F4B|nr:hypothetical protein [Paenibacillus alvei]NEZ44830.1 hypothetical protein [Paenibacillus alvei]